MLLAPSFYNRSVTQDGTLSPPLRHATNTHVQTSRVAGCLILGLNHHLIL